MGPEALNSAGAGSILASEVVAGVGGAAWVTVLVSEQPRSRRSSAENVRTFFIFPISTGMAAIGIPRFARNVFWQARTFVITNRTKTIVLTTARVPDRAAGRIRRDANRQRLCRGLACRCGWIRQHWAPRRERRKFCDRPRARSLG